MGAHRVRYEGPPSLAVQAARLLAEADGIELTSAGAPEPLADASGEAGLTLTVEGTSEAVEEAVATIRETLAGGVRLTVVEAPEG